MIRDRKYLDYLRGERCLITGCKGGDMVTVDPMHIGTRGKGKKSSDDEALPILHTIHAMAHNEGEITTLRNMLPDAVLREALRAYARQLYREYLNDRDD